MMGCGGLTAGQSIKMVCYLSNFWTIDLLVFWDSLASQNTEWGRQHDFKCFSPLGVFTHTKVGIIEFPEVGRNQAPSQPLPYRQRA